LKILVDSNVVIAAIVFEHVHHGPSAALLMAENLSFVIPSHSFAEAFNQLTRPERVMVKLQPKSVAAALLALHPRAVVRSLSVAETMAAITAFAQRDGRGARVYDYLIGHAGMLEGVDVIATWNVKHFLALFPTLRVATPQQILES
jgi:predicted nucleic acid-binding protein